jgi:hypothetical protein
MYMMTETAPLDYDAWTAAVFDGKHPEHVGLWNADLWFGPAAWLLKYATRLFSEAGILLEHYTPRQLRLGLHALLFGWELKDAVWEKELPWPFREECIFSMATLFDEVFSRDPLNEWCEMWWDAFRSFDENPDPRMTDAILTVLAGLLYRPEEHCQHAALHGLGHLPHPGRAGLIQRWLADTNPTSTSLRAYAASAAVGAVL